MEDLLKGLEGMGLGEMRDFFEVSECAKAYEKNGIEGVYEETLNDLQKAKKEMKKDLGKEFNETRFEVGYVYTKIEHVTNLLKWQPIVVSAKDRKVIADELKKLAEELENIK